MNTEFEKDKLKKYLKGDLYNLLKKYNCFIAGGFINSLFTNTEINDVDVYFRNKKDLANLLSQELKGEWIISYTDKAILLKYGTDIKLQLIYFKYFDTAEDIFETFDFTVCMGAYDFTTERFEFHKNFFKDNTRRALIFNRKTDYPIVSALRVDKYKKKGYSISRIEYLKIMMCVNNLKIENYKQLKEQLGGMYGENYDSIFSTEKTKEFDILEIIDKLDNSKYTEKEVDFKRVEIDDWDEFVHKVTKEKINYFVYDEQPYRVFNGKIEKFDISESKREIYKEVSVSDVVKFPLIKYKWVQKTEDGNYKSYYNKNFEYNIGEIVSDRNNGVFCLEEKDLPFHSYANKKDNTILKLEIEKIEDVKSICRINNGDCSVFRCMVLEEMDKNFLDKVKQISKERGIFF